MTHTSLEGAQGWTPDLESFWRPHQWFQEGSKPLQAARTWEDVTGEEGLGLSPPAGAAEHCHTGLSASFLHLCVQNHREKAEKGTRL